MPDIKRIATIGGTFVAILGIGFFMQSGQGQAPQPQQPASMGANPAPSLEVSDVVLTSAGLGSPGLSVPSTPDHTPAAPIPEAPVQVALNDAPLTAQPGATLPRPAPDLASVGAIKPTVETNPQATTTGDSFDAAAPVIQTAATDSGAPLPTISPTSEPAVSAECEPRLTAKTIPAALIQLSLEAPCMGNERVTIHHEGMMFTEVTDAAGQLDLTVPALSQSAVLIASFSNGAGAVASTKVAALSNFDRSVIQSTGSGGVSLHALEFGAQYGEAGHVWAQSVGDFTNAATGEGGFLIQLGDPTLDKGHVAEVYSFPSALADNGSTVGMSVDVEVTSANCGRDVEAQSLQIKAGGKLSVQTLEMTMPDCDAVGDFLVLKKLVDDVKVARN